MLRDPGGTPLWVQRIYLLTISRAFSMVFLTVPPSPAACSSSGCWSDGNRSSPGAMALMRRLLVLGEGSTRKYGVRGEGVWSP